MNEELSDLAKQGIGVSLKMEYLEMTLFTNDPSKRLVDKKGNQLIIKVEKN